MLGITPAPSDDIQETISRCIGADPAVIERSDYLGYLRFDAQTGEPTLVSDSDWGLDEDAGPPASFQCIRQFPGWPVNDVSFPLAQRFVLQNPLTEIEAALGGPILEDGARAKLLRVELALDSAAALATAVPADRSGVPAQHARGLRGLGAESGVELAIREKDSYLGIL